MPKTKIINVQKGDNFEDVFGAFKKTDAQDIIFIFPKTSKFTSNSEYFEEIKQEADQSGKSVSIMTADPILGRLAANYGFDLMSKGQSGAKPTKQPVASIATADYKPYSKKVRIEAETENDEIESANLPDDNMEATLASIRRPLNNKSHSERPVRDIIGENESERNVDIDNDNEDESFDIGINKSGRIARKKDSQIEEIWSTKKFFGGSTVSRKLKLPKKVYLAIIVGIVIIAGIVMSFNFGRATVSIYPLKENKKFDLKITASSVISTVDLIKNHIPGQLLSASAESNGEFPTSGQKDVIQKASGKITVYNKSAGSQRLVATTRFESPDGLIFRIPQTIIIPAATKNGTEIIPGSTETVVNADRAGADYNIGPARFTVPGFKSTPHFDEFYAISTKPMAGGIIGPSKIVTEEDYTKAVESIKKSIQDKILNSLRKQSGNLKIMDDIAISFDAPIANAEVGDASPNLTISIKGKALTVGFREENVAQLAQNYVKSNYNSEILEGSLQINYNSPILDGTSKSLSFTIAANVVTIPSLDLEKIKTDILGMNENAIRSYFKNGKNIISVKISMFPIWIKSVPKNSAKVFLQINTQ